MRRSDPDRGPILPELRRGARPHRGGRRLTSPPTAVACAYCGAELAASQEYCLRCGARRTGLGRLGALPSGRGRVARRALALLVVAAAGAAGAIAVTHESQAAPRAVRAIGGSIAVDPGGEDAKSLVTWPKSDGWTIVLASVPKAEGKMEALAVAEVARSRALRRVGILDSSRFASAHPGYWLVVTGVYLSEPEATGSLRAARAVLKTARVQRIAR